MNTNSKSRARPGSGESFLTILYQQDRKTRGFDDLRQQVSLRKSVPKPCYWHKTPEDVISTLRRRWSHSGNSNPSVPEAPGGGLRRGDRQSGTCHPTSGKNRRACTVRCRRGNRHSRWLAARHADKSGRWWAGSWDVFPEKVGAAESFTGCVQAHDVKVFASNSLRSISTERTTSQLLTAWNGPGPEVVDGDFINLRLCRRRSFSQFGDQSEREFRRDQTVPASR